MKKLLVALFLMLVFTVKSAISADMSFVQVDGIRFSPETEAQTENLKSIVDKINKEHDIDFVVFTGNNISKPDAEYLKSFFKIAKKLDKPFYVALGNKDVNKRKGLGKDLYMNLARKKVFNMKRIKTPSYYFEKNGVLFVIADGSKEVIPLQSGYYRPEVISWLDSLLTKKKNKNVIIIQHFPIIPPAEKENYYTFKADEYLKMINNHKNVKAVISGHFNVNNEIEKNGIRHISTAEAPTYRVIEIIDYDTDRPEIWSTLKE